MRHRREGLVLTMFRRSCGASPTANTRPSTTPASAATGATSSKTRIWPGWGLVDPAAFRAALLAPQRDSSDVAVPLMQTLACGTWLPATAHHTSHRQAGLRPPAPAVEQTRHRP
ncbi:hypothetical protein ACIA8R_45230 [Nonomuraea sp. NPDC051191]|uniref:hypothetical protein n=1 Tax=Nonomuraea sp. NPDC051191 TaxID=3364372 RepID=UPI00379BA9A4